MKSFNLQVFTLVVLMGSLCFFSGCSKGDSPADVSFETRDKSGDVVSSDSSKTIVEEVSDSLHSKAEKTSAAAKATVAESVDATKETFQAVKKEAGEATVALKEKAQDTIDATVTKTKEFINE